MVACAANAHNASQDRRHATGRRHALLGAFQGGQFILKHGDRRVCKTRVNITWLGATKTRRRLSGTIKAETGI